MKNLFSILFVGGLMFSSTLFAQSAKVTTAGNHLKYGDLLEAKEAIDAATVHEKTMNKAKTYVYRGKIYLALGSSTDETFAAAREGAFIEAAKAFKKAKELADSRTDVNELDKLYLGTSDAIFQEAIDKYNAGDYLGASKEFALCGEIKGEYNRLDTLAYFNAGLSAGQGGANAEAIEYYNKIKKTEYKGGAIYVNIADIYLKDEKIDEAIAVLEEGRVQFPDNQSILIKEINIFLKNDRKGDALAMLDKAIEADPNNSSFYFARGSLYEQQEDMANAEADYKKAVEIDPNNATANYNLGALYINQSSVIAKEMNALGMSSAEQKKYKELKVQLMDLYQKAVPYLEKSFEADPSDKLVQQTLLQLYGKLSMTDKYNEMKKVYEAD